MATLNKETFDTISKMEPGKDRFAKQKQTLWEHFGILDSATNETFVDRYFRAARKEMEKRVRPSFERFTITWDAEMKTFDDHMCLLTPPPQTISPEAKVIHQQLLTALPEIRSEIRKVTEIWDKSVKRPNEVVNNERPAKRARMYCQWTSAQIF